MRILTLDASGPVLGVALMRDGVVRADLRMNTGLTHSETLMPMVDQALRCAGMAPDELDLIGCVAGPGSFTGVRIGVCTAKALAHAHGIVTAQLNALEVLAMGAYGFDGTICAILDARRGQVYSAAFAFPEGELPRRVLDDAALGLEDYIALLPKAGRLLFVGDGAPVYGEQIRRALGARALIAPPHLCHLSAAAGCVLALRKPETHGDYLALQPVYLRAPQAERERMARSEGGDG